MEKITWESLPLCYEGKEMDFSGLERFVVVMGNEGEMYIIDREQTNLLSLLKEHIGWYVIEDFETELEAEEYLYFSIEDQR